MYNEGISKGIELITLGAKTGIVDLNGSWYTYNDEKLGWGYRINWEIIQNKNEALGPPHSLELSDFQAEHMIVTEEGLKDESET